MRPIIAVLLLAAVGNIVADAATINWTNTAGGNWSVAANWSPNQVPGSSDNAVITANGSYTVTLNTSATVGSLTLGGASGAQTLTNAVNTLTLNNASVVNANGVLALGGGTLSGVGRLTVNGQFNWTGGSIASSTLTVATNGVLVLAGQTNTDYPLSGILTNAGTVRLVSGNLQIDHYNTGQGELINLPGALVDMKADVSIDLVSTWPASFINYGTVRKSGGTGTSSIYPIFNNFGLLDVQSGIVSLSGSYNLTNGTLNFGISSLASFGKISLSGSPAKLAGTLSANLNNGYVPAAGNSFAVLTYGSRTGTFTNFNLPFAVAWQTNYGSTAFNLSVLNVRPTLAAIPDQTVNELTTLTVTNSASDPDIGQTLTFALVSAPSGMTINPTTGLISWTPQQTNSPSTSTVVVSVTDNGTPPLSATNSFTVIVREVNVAPSLPTIPTQTVYEMNLLTVTNTATNSNIHATITGYGLVNPPAGMSINFSGVITWTPDQTQPGTYTITTVMTNLDVFDSANPNLTATNSFTVMVYEVNYAPSVFPPGPQTVNELTLMTVTNFATEASPHSVITGWGLQNAPAGASINNGVVTWTPSQNQSPGTYNFTVVATNSNPYDPVNPHLTGSASFSATVREVNVAPSLPTISTQIVTELTLLTVTNTATNANIHATITGYKLVNPPSNMVINASGIITWTPSQAQSPGTNMITTIVTNMDSFDFVNPQLTATNSFTVVVRKVNAAPYYIRRVGQTLTTDIPGANVSGGSSYWQISLPYPSMRTSGNQAFLARPDSQTEANGVGAASSPALQWFTTIPVSTLPGLNTPPTSIVSGSSDFIWTNGVIVGATSQFMPIELIDATLFIQGVTQGSGAITFSWNAIAGQTYQVQYNTNLTQTNWINLGNVLTGADSTLSFTNSIDPDPQRFYRVKWLP
jgi:hypothetical protein